MYEAYHDSKAMEYPNNKDGEHVDYCLPFPGMLFGTQTQLLVRNHLVERSNEE